jgi:hypothetical protein
LRPVFSSLLFDTSMSPPHPVDAGAGRAGLHAGLRAFPGPERRQFGSSEDAYAPRYILCFFL